MSLFRFLVVFFTFVIFTEAGMIRRSMPVENSHPNYEWHYSVHDSVSGDVKDQFEHRQGDFVVGRYSLVDPDGYRRIVEYTSEPLIGFTAKVRREPLIN